MIGKFNDEDGAVPIIEFVGLRPKIYSLQTPKNAEAKPSLEEKQRCKGMQWAAQKKLKHAH